MDQTSGSVTTATNIEHEDSSRSVYNFWLVTRSRTPRWRSWVPVQEGYGFERWRVLNEEYEQQQRTRVTIILTNILRAELEDPIEVSLDVCEGLRNNEEVLLTASKQVSRATKSKNKKFQGHIASNACRSTTFKHDQEALREICEAQERGQLQLSLDQKLYRWRLEHCRKGTGATSKSNCDGKRGHDPKDKGENEDRLCFYCWIQGHLESECRKQKTCWGAFRLRCQQKLHNPQNRMKLNQSHNFHLSLCHPHAVRHCHCRRSCLKR